MENDAPGTQEVFLVFVVVDDDFVFLPRGRSVYFLDDVFVDHRFVVLAVFAFADRAANCA